MAVIYTNTDQTRNAASTPVYALGAGDTLIVGPDAQLVTTGSLSPVITGPNGVDLRIQGDLIAAISHGVELNAGADIRIAATGSISAGRDGIHVNDGIQSISNAGAIEAEWTAIDMGGGGELINNGLISGGRGVVAANYLQLLNAGTIQAFDNPDDPTWQAHAIQVAGSADIINSGVIQSTEAAAIVTMGALVKLDLTNTGLISRLDGTAIATGGANDVIRNDGTIIGTALLGDGGDVFDGTRGVSGGVSGDGGDDMLLGGTGNDRLFGGTGDDALAGNGGDDNLGGGDGNDTIDGGAGNDTIAGGFHADVMDGGDGFDVLSYWDEVVGLTVSLAAGEASGGFAEGDTFVNFEGVRGGSGADTLTGSNGADRLWGGNGNDFMAGSGGNDRLSGDGGDDTLFGGAGLDVLRGGNGNDTFRFNNIVESTVAANGRDRILDFSTTDLDVIHLASIDADADLASNQAFTFIGTAAFSNLAGQLRYATVGNTTLVSGDVNGDGVADFAIQLAGNIALTADDFVL